MLHGIDFDTTLNAIPDAFSFDQRIGRCFELAFLGLGGAPGPNWRLCHGGWFNRKPGVSSRGWIAHAWLENVKTGHRWEPITRVLYTADEWDAYVDSDVEVRYDKAEAWAASERDGTYGDWHDSKYPAHLSQSKRHDPRAASLT